MDHHNLVLWRGRNHCNMDFTLFAISALPWLIIWIHFFEAAVHYAIINGQSPDKPHWNRNWHHLFFRFWILVYFLLFTIGVEWHVLLMGMVARQFIFSSRLNYLRGKPFAYVSVNGTDKYFGMLPDKFRKVLFFLGVAAPLVFSIIWCAIVLF